MFVALETPATSLPVLLEPELEQLFHVIPKLRRMELEVAK